MTGWCAKYHAQWPASIINARVRHIYYDNKGGFIFDSSIIQVFCMYSQVCVAPRAPSAA